MERVIIYDNNQSFIENLSKRIQTDLEDVKVEIYDNIESLREALISNVDQYIFSIIDIDTDTDKCHSVIELISTQYIPMLILTDVKNLSLRDQTIKKYPIIDYATKDSSKNFHYIVSMIKHMKNAQDIEILLVSNSEHDRNYMYDNLLRRYPFDIIDVKDKEGVGNAIEQYENIKMMIIDIMPEDEALEIVEEVREFEQKDSLAIMAVTSRENSYLAAKYLQLGANDFIVKPIEIETFHSRMNVMIETLSLFRELHQLANVDYLTGLYNRRYFFESGNMLFANAQRKNISIYTAMIDIDHFKSINDTYGHNVGDIVLKEVAYLFKENFRSSDLLARVGGEEFALILVDPDEAYIPELFENLRKKVENLKIRNDDQFIEVTISIGVTDKIANNLEQTIHIADENLYKAKTTGRNKVVIE